MAQVVIALGSNLGNPHQQLQQAGIFLNEISSSEVILSPIYKSEPIGPSENDFLNAVAVLESDAQPQELFNQLKDQEHRQGRPSRYPKWTARTLDLDIIAFGNLVLQTDSLIIPHAEYARRLFVLLPLRDVLPHWCDPVTAQPIQKLIELAPKMEITKTELHW